MLYKTEKSSKTVAWGDGIETDEQGYFVLERVPRTPIVLELTGASLDGGRATFDLDAGTLGPEPEFRVDVLQRFRVELPGEPDVDSLAVLAEDGSRLRVRSYEENSQYEDDLVSRGVAGFPVCAVGEDAAELALFAGDVEVRRVPLALQPSELTVVRP